MIRILITQVVLFLLPFMAYALYRLVTGVGPSPFASRNVAFALSMAGLCLALGSFAFLALTGGTVEGTYVPTQYIDGELVRGGFQER